MKDFTQLLLNGTPATTPMRLIDVGTPVVVPTGCARSLPLGVGVSPGTQRWLDQCADVMRANEALLPDFDEIVEGFRKIAETNEHDKKEN